MTEITHVWIDESKYISDNIVNLATIDPIHTALNRAERDYWDKVREDYFKHEQENELMDSLGDEK